MQSAEKVFHFLIKWDSFQTTSFDHRFFFRILSIFACVIEDTTPPIPTSSKINFPQLPASPQQLKKRFESNDSNKNEKDIIHSDTSTSLTSSKDSTLISSAISTDKDKKVNRTQLGAFGNNPSMMRLFDLIRQSYQTHRSLISSTETDRFGQLLATTLTCMKSVLNLVSIQDILKHLEETLGYLKSTFNIDKINTIQCTQEVRVRWWNSWYIVDSFSILVFAKSASTCH